MSLNCRMLLVLSFMFWIMPGLAKECQAGAESAIRIAAILSLTGQAAASNSSVVSGIQMAVDEINTSGGVLGRPLELLLIDNESTPIGSSVAAQKAVDNKVTAIIGASWSSHSLAIAPIAQKNRIPMISPLSTIPKLTAIGDMIFRVCYTDDFQGKMLANFAYNDLKVRRALVFVDLTSDYSMELARVFSERFGALGGSIDKEIEYKSNQLSYDRQISEAVGKKADVVVLTGYDESGFIAAKLQEAGIQAKIIGGDGWGDGDFYTSGGNKLKTAFFLTHWTRESENPFSRRFVEKIPEGVPVIFGIALGYDAVYVLVEAIRQTGSSDREKIRQSLAKITYTKGVTGAITFDDQGDPVGKNLVVIEIRNGVPTYVKTISPP